MGESLRDTIWTFIGAILALTAIIVSILIYLAQKQRKRLRVENVAWMPLARIGSQGIEGLEVTYKGRSLANPSIIMARISNPGNAAIQSADFEAPITLEFEKNTEILETSVVETQPNGIPVSAEIKASTAVLSPHLLNPGDVVVVRIFVGNGKPKFKPFARIAGVRVIETQAGTSLWPPVLSILGLLILVGSMILSPAPTTFHIMAVRGEEIPYAIAAAFGGLLMIGVMSRDFIARIHRISERMHAFF